jgi:hypothetical protein
MIFTLTTVFLLVGAWPMEEMAIARNVTLGYSNDNRIRFDTVLFTDGRTCSVLDLERYRFHTAEDAMRTWNARGPPFAASRYEENWHLTTNACTAFDNPTNVIALIGIILGIFGVFADGTCVFCIYHKYYWRGRHREYRGTPILPVTDMPKIQPSVATSVPKGLSPYAAQLIAEASLQRGDICPVSQEPLDSVALLVPECGHVLSEAAAAAKLPTECYMCRKPVVYTRVEAKLKLVPVSDTALSSA